MIDAAALRLAAEYLGSRKWASAAEAFRRACPEGEVGLLSPQDQLRRNLALNFADLLAYRPGVLRVLESTPGDPRFSVDITETGRPTVSFEGKRLCEGPDPVASLGMVMRQLKASREAGKPLALLGTADGYLLVALARHPVPLLLGKLECVHYFEANPANLLSAMMIHDMSGDTGPIRQKRFQWHVGADCVKQFRDACMADPALPYPDMVITAPPSGAEIGKGLNGVLNEILEADRARKRQIETRAARVTLERLIDATSERPSRKPRALLLTTRLSTVLQYSTLDMAEGLRAMGWHAEVVMEPTLYHTLTYPLLREAMITSDPDLIIQIDHIRAEHGDLFPESIPFVCWAQDHLCNLTNSEAGRRQGPMDFFMSSLGDWYAREYGYPSDRMIPTGKMTKVPEIPETWENDGPDLTYVSTASKLPERAADEYVRYFEPSPELARVARLASDRLIALYAEGRSFSGTMDMVGLIGEAARSAGVNRELCTHQMAVDLFEKVNNPLYRHQALGWVADLADEMNLKFEIYGSGWDRHPRLAKYFKGYVKYGPDLERLTRATKVNLQIVPYFCLHQRLLDGIAAGGFFLVRSHPADLALRDLCRFVHAHLPQSVRTIEEARAAIDPSHREELERHAAAVAGISDLLDAVQQARNARAMGLFADDAPMPPHIGEVSFGSKQELRARLTRFLPDAPLRRMIAREQRDTTVEKMSYRAGMLRTVRALHERLLERAAAKRSVA